jgi:hypothetical protein
VTATPPTVQDLAELTGLPTGTPTLGEALTVAGGWLAGHYRCDPYTDAHYLAQLHMAARWVAAKGAPLGVLDAGDLGATYIPSRNVIVRELLTDPIGGFA